MEDRKGTSRWCKRNVGGRVIFLPLVRTMLASNQPKSRYATYSNTIPTVWQVGSLWLRYEGKQRGEMPRGATTPKRPLLLTSARSRG